MKYRHLATHCVALAVVPALFAAGVVFADAPETALPPITVSAHGGLAVPYDQSGVSAEVVDIEQLKQAGIYTVSEALTTVPGVYVIPGGGANQQGNTSQVVLRGMSSDKYTMTMIDGMRLSSNGGADALVTSNVVGRTDLLSLGQLEVLKGSQGAVYGGGAVGGVIFMETPEGEGKPSVTLFNEAGSHNSYTGQITTQGRQQNLAWYMSAGYRRADNDMQTADGKKSTERNAFESEIRSEALRLDYYVDPHNQFTVTYRREDSEYGYDSLESFPGYPSYNNYRFRSTLVTTKWRTALSRNFAATLMFGYYGYDSRFSADELRRMRNLQLEWRNSYRWCKHQSTTWALSWNRNDYDAYSDGSVKNPYQNLENVYGLAAEHLISPTDTWNITLAARLDYSNIYDALSVLRLSTSYRFLDNRARVFGSVGTGYRAPSSFQRSRGSYAYYWQRYQGNPHLQNEESVSADMGIEYALTDNHSLSATLFWEQVDKPIDTMPDATGTQVFVNMPGHWTTQGVELAINGTLEENWNTGYKISWTYAQPKTTDDRPIPYSVRQVWQAELYTSPWEGLTTGLGLSAAVGRSSYSSTPYSKLDNYYNLRWYARYKVNDHLQLHVGIENLTNQRYITEGHYRDLNASFISAGITIHAGCTISF